MLGRKIFFFCFVLFLYCWTFPVSLLYYITAFLNILARLLFWVCLLCEISRSLCNIYTEFKNIFLRPKFKVYGRYLFFHQMTALQKPQKCFLFHFKSNFCSRGIQICFSIFPLFLPVSHCFRGWLKITLKNYDVINCLNKNLLTHFMEKSCTKCAPKASPRSLLILVNNPKQTLHAWDSFENKIFWKKIIKKVNFIFSVEPSPF